MKKPAGVVEVFLQPGEYYWGDRYNRLRTILGSCVTLTAWHPQQQLGGMTHIMLPDRPSSKAHENANLDGKYAEDAMVLLLDDMRTTDKDLSRFQLKLFGGGQMFANLAKPEQAQKTNDIGARNIEITKELLKALGLKTHSEHIGGQGHRSLMFDVWNGYVWLKHVSLPEQ